jgi:hypothetical protein
VRRTRLIWFALGAAAVAIMTILTNLFLTPEPERPIIAYLELTEPLVVRDQVRDEDMIADQTGQLARTCGAKFFETTFLYNDHLPTMEIALTPENEKSVRCILAEASKRSIQTNIIFRKATNAQTH